MDLTVPCAAWNLQQETVFDSVNPCEWLSHAKTFENRPAWGLLRNGMRTHAAVFALCMASIWTFFAPPGAQAAAAAPADTPPPPGALSPPYETANNSIPPNAIDNAVLADLGACGIKPARSCSDAVFLRRVYLDLIGTLPAPMEANDFLQDKRPDKRALLVDALLARDEYADYWSMKWCDVLRVKAEFPINLWPNAVQAYHRWIHDALRDNMPYDQFARALLTSSGSNFRVPPVNFYRAVQGRKPADIAAAVALTFMGSRVETWPEAQRAGMAAFFSRIAYKKTDEWKEEIVCLDPALPDAPIQAMLPDGTAMELEPDKDPRALFAAWLLSPDNPWFARAAVNRVWAWLMGRGVIHEPDDIRPDNPPVNPELLACLEKEFVTSGYDLRRLYRTIVNSRTYQQSPIPRGDGPDAERHFACYPVRRLEAEVLVDVLNGIGGTGEEYSSAIPEPLAFVPADLRTITLADGSITSPFLEMFGRPSRDTGLESERNNQSTDAQRLYLLNSTAIQKKIENSPRLRVLFQGVKGNPQALVRRVYLNLLSRYPTKQELQTALTYAKTDGLLPRQAAADLVWALINSKEFLYRH